MKKKGYMFVGVGLVIVLVVGLFVMVMNRWNAMIMGQSSSYVEESEPDTSEMDEKADKKQDKELYARIYEHMEMYRPDYRGDIIWEDAVEEEVAADGAIPEAPAMEEAAPSESGPAMDSANGSMENDFAGTNLQVEYVDEGDIVKNDGRYLYQLLMDEEYGLSKIQIIDTKDGLKEIDVIDGFNSISEFYLWEDTLVVVESLWAQEPISEEETMRNPHYYGGSSFSRIHFYDVSDKENVTEIHTFNIRGHYKSSRISEGYLYFFSRYELMGEIKENKPETYIPTVGGELLTHDSLYLPEDIKSTSYLMMVSIDLANPTSFVDRMAVVSDGSYFYVSGKNIYVLDYVWADESEPGIQCDKMKVVRFAYGDGQIRIGAEGLIDGLLLDQFAMDEYQDHFRVITTVSPYKMEEVVDDVSGEVLGYFNYEAMPETSSVYVMDENLEIVGSIEGLAEDERVYSARFMGDTGYFVTFRQMDPLFSVDFSDPTNPQIVGELKITGFSEYMHVYGENLMVGIGYEADPETGMTQGIKLSMFDISNPNDVKEVNKLVLDKYDYSDAFYNHHAVLVSGRKNLIGFLSEGYQEQYIREYGVYSYGEEAGFDQMFTANCNPDDYNYYQVRGTYINDTFYVLQQNGGIDAYDLNTYELVDSLEIE